MVSETTDGKGTMKIDPNPLFRKAITPWYDSSAACWMLLAAVLVIAVFSGVGISVAQSRPDYQQHLWVPITLLVLSLFVGGSIIYRLIKRRYEHQLPDRDY